MEDPIVVSTNSSPRKVLFPMTHALHTWRAVRSPLKDFASTLIQGKLLSRFHTPALCRLSSISQWLIVKKLFGHQYLQNLWYFCWYGRSLHWNWLLPQCYWYVHSWKCKYWFRCYRLCSLLSLFNSGRVSRRERLHQTRRLNNHLTTFFLSRYGTYSILSAPKDAIHQIQAEIYARGPVAAGVNAEPIVKYAGGIVTDKKVWHMLVCTWHKL